MSTTYELTREDTGQELSAYQIRDEAARLDGAAVDGLPVPWVAKTPAHITPAPTCTTCGGAESGRKPRTEDSELPARTWARLSGARQWPQIPHDALTAHGRMEAEFDSAHQQIQDLRDMAFWAEQEQHKAWSAISDDYRAKRAATEARYDREIGQLHAGLDHAPYAAYVQALPDYVRGNTATVVIGRHSSVYAELAPENIQADVPMIETSGHEPPQPQDLTPAERAIVADATQRRKKLAQAAHGERAELPAPEPEGTVRASRWARLAAWFGGATTRRRQAEQDGVQ